MFVTKCSHSLEHNWTKYLPSFIAIREDGKSTLVVTNYRDHKVQQNTYMISDGTTVQDQHAYLLYRSTHKAKDIPTPTALKLHPCPETKSALLQVKPFEQAAYQNFVHFLMLFALLQLEGHQSPQGQYMQTS
jgi:hypothetical protein